MRRPSVRLSTFSEFLLPSFTKALQCLESDNGSNMAIAELHNDAFSTNIGNVFQIAIPVLCFLYFIILINN